MKLFLVLCLAVCASACWCKHGICETVIVPDGIEVICACAPQYSGTICDCERKELRIALILSAIVGWAGADRFYLSRPISAFAKFALPCAIIAIGLICIFSSTQVQPLPTYSTPLIDAIYDAQVQKKYQIGKAITFIGFFVLLTWCVSDFLAICTGDLDDAACGSLLRDAY